MKVAIVHDWLTGMRGGERVLEVFCRLFPEAVIFTLFHFPGKISETIESHPIVTSRLQYLPFKKRHYRMYLPLFPSAIESFDLEGFDLVISTSHAVAKGVIPGRNSLSVCYCHTPMRYIWDHYKTYFEDEHMSRIVRTVAPWIRDYLRWWDQRSSDRVNHFIANSRFVAERIQRIYNRKADVIHPPVDTAFYTPSFRPPEDYYLAVSAQAPYKRLDLAIDAFNRMGKKLILIGWGTQRSQLQLLAGDTIEFKGYLTDEEVREYYRNCRALIFPGVEDFGLTPLEAQACGRPVIAYSRGGVLESVIQGISGLFFHEQSADALVEAVAMFETMSFSTDVLRNRAVEFDAAVMRKHLDISIRKLLNGGTGESAEK